MHWHSISIEDTLRELNTDIRNGLTQVDIQERQRLYGRNILDAKKDKDLLQKFPAQFADFMIIILICAAIISLVVSYMDGKPDFVDPIIIMMIIILNAFLGVLQEDRKSVV